MSRDNTVITNNENKSNNSEFKRNKQIEEKKKIISDICPFYKEYGTCEQCNTELDIDDEPCYWECMANCIIRNNYRKASEVAEEIFAEIEKLLEENQFTLLPPYRSEITDWKTVFRLKLASDIAELKKKYAEEKK